ncbi:MAG: DNA polymerase III subunit delta' [Bacteroidaceae bacterium]|nr:DNA polymerase III subunit delta' [Bacteroidaceae bacterium]
MFFRDIIGQDCIKQRLIKEARERRVPHALLFTGPEGVGKLPLAIAFSRYLCCQNPGEEDACGECPSCKMFNKLQHPDLHFVYPVINVSKSSDKKTLSDDMLNKWRPFVLETPYFNINHWLSVMGAENQQATIYTRESEEIQRKLTLKSSQGGYKVMIMWLPEKMQEECSNKILKILEEPPTQTVFILVSELPEALLQTIRSRTQEIEFKRLTNEQIEHTLIEKDNIGPDNARNISHIANGSYLRALEAISINEDAALFFDMFVLLMRLAYQRKVKEMKQWSEQVASWGRERQKNFLTYCQQQIREYFIYNFHDESLNYMNTQERDFSVRFARFINERNVIGIMNELTEAQRHIEQNVNARMVFFDFALKTIVLLIQ